MSTYVDRTIRALELVSSGEVSTAELAHALDVDTRTARRLLQRLEAAGVLVVRRPARPRYAAGPRLAALVAALDADG